MQVGLKWKCEGEGGTYEEEEPEEEAVEVAREQREVVVRRGRHAVQDRRDGVEDEHRGRVRDEQPDCPAMYQRSTHSY